MRLKKGFTLAEILIVLMVIGVIATMTVPSMMKGVSEAQLKTGYKKAYNTIANFAAMERVSGALPSRAKDESILPLYQSLNSSLSVSTFVQLDVNGGTLAAPDNFKSCLTYDNGDGVKGTLGSGTDCISISSLSTLTGNGQISKAAWLITEDNFAYTLARGGAESVNCDTKQAIAGKASDAEATTASCAIVIVDVNGVSKGPNTFEAQGLTQALDTNTTMQAITGDLFKIYLGIDGATAGPRTTTSSGRIMADLK